MGVSSPGTLPPNFIQGPNSRSPLPSPSSSGQTSRKSLESRHGESGSAQWFQEGLASLDYLAGREGLERPEPSSFAIPSTATIIDDLVPTQTPFESPELAAREIREANPSLGHSGSSSTSALRFKLTPSRLPPLEPPDVADPIEEDSEYQHPRTLATIDQFPNRLKPALLERLEKYVEWELAARGCSTHPTPGRLQVFSEAFQLVIDSFRTYSPFMQLIKREYDGCLEVGFNALVELTQARNKLETIDCTHEALLKVVYNEAHVVEQEVRGMLKDKEQELEDLHGQYYKDKLAWAEEAKELKLEVQYVEEQAKNDLDEMARLTRRKLALEDEHGRIVCCSARLRLQYCTRHYELLNTRASRLMTILEKYAQSKEEALDLMRNNIDDISNTIYTIFKKVNNRLDDIENQVLSDQKRFEKEQKEIEDMKANMGKLTPRAVWSEMPYNIKDLAILNKDDKGKVTEWDSTREVLNSCSDSMFEMNKETNIQKRKVMDLEEEVTTLKSQLTAAQAIANKKIQEKAPAPAAAKKEPPLPLRKKKLMRWAKSLPAPAWWRSAGLAAQRRRRSAGLALQLSAHWVRPIEGGNRSNGKKVKKKGAKGEAVQQPKEIQIKEVEKIVYKDKVVYKLSPEDEMKLARLEGMEDGIASLNQDLTTMEEKATEAELAKKRAQEEAAAIKKELEEDRSRQAGERSSLAMALGCKAEKIQDKATLLVKQKGQQEEQIRELTKMTKELKEKNAELSSRLGETPDMVAAALKEKELAHSLELEEIEEKRLQKERDRAKREAEGKKANQRERAMTESWKEVQAKEKEQRLMQEKQDEMDRQKAYYDELISSTENDRNELIQQTTNERNDLMANIQGLEEEMKALHQTNQQQLKVMRDNHEKEADVLQGKLTSETERTAVLEESVQSLEKALKDITDQNTKDKRAQKMLMSLHQAEADAAAHKAKQELERQKAEADKMLSEAAASGSQEAKQAAEEVQRRLEQASPRICTPPCTYYWWEALTLPHWCFTLGARPSVCDRASAARELPRVRQGERREGAATLASGQGAEEPLSQGMVEAFVPWDLGHGKERAGYGRPSRGLAAAGLSAVLWASCQPASMIVDRLLNAGLLHRVPLERTIV
ncbi:hypothetical protein CYMTET_27035 [Cymbomonas tetramitiformis]|uniref:Translin-associated factor X-interacting protein 1 N-terminal domain-containing protein n=1 Tax=Cymbomonas tetramitiformis TaxID=36881 RepID=A0AAE0KXN1_9CHLO|nr:hypothetical protein CYMTET_27035 [Cymbomonas tetramitiformis]